MAKRSRKYGKRKLSARRRVSGRRPARATTLRRKAKKVRQLKRKYSGSTAGRPAKRSKRSVSTRVDITQQWKSKASKTGVIKKESAIANTLLNMSLSKRVLQWKGISDFNGRGHFNIGVRETSVTANTWTAYECPVYLMDLTPLRAGMWPMYRMTVDSLQSGTTGPSVHRVNWVAQAGQDLNGSNQNGWQIKYATPAYPAEGVINSLHHGRVNVALNLFGARTKSTKFTVAFIEFNDDIAVPLSDQDVVITDNVTAVKDIHDQYWMGKIKEMVRNPIAYDNKHPKEYMKIVKQQVVKIDPAGTMDADTSAQCMTLKMSHGIHRTIDLHEGKIREDAPADMINQTMVNPHENYFSSATPIKKRVFLMIKAENYQRALSGGVTADNTPSFDINVHLQQYCMAQ